MAAKKIKADVFVNREPEDADWVVLNLTDAQASVVLNAVIEGDALGISLMTGNGKAQSEKFDYAT